MDLVLRAGRTPSGLPLLTLAGEVDLATLPRLREALVRLATDAGSEVAVVDLDGVTSIDDAGLGVLVGGLGRLRAHGGDLLLICTSERLLDLFRLTRLDRVFEIHASLAAVPR